MNRISISALPILIFLLFSNANSESQEVKGALVQFMERLSPGNAARDQNWGWNTSSDPCNDRWVGIACDATLQFVRKIVLEGYNLSGILDATSLCMTKSLIVLSLKSNSIAGVVPEEMSKCKQLTHLYLSGNQFSGNLPDSLSQLSNLKRLEISNNNFSGKLPDVARISGLLTFYAENNQLSGEIPDFDFRNLKEFNVSNNNFSGPIPDVKGQVNADSFLGNPGLCGKPLSNACPPTPPPKKKTKNSTKQVLIYSGYIIIGLFVLLFIALKLVKKNKPKAKKTDTVKKDVASETNSNKPSGTSSGLRIGENRSEYSITSAEGGIVTSSLVFFSSPAVKELRFEDLLRAPAELLGRGKHGSLYKVMLDNGAVMAVKRLKEWGISSEDFKRRMQRIDQVKHQNVLPLVAYYCSDQEKLLVYEYQQNGSLFRLLHGSQNGQSFDWGSRLGVAAGIATSLAFMHNELHEDGIAHGNLKSTNILFNDNMDPIISEYGLMVIKNQDQSFLAQSSSFRSDKTSSTIYSNFTVDVYGYGVILLEILTGKLVQNSGFNLAKWVHSVVREEWTVEVFDKTLISEGANEERMVNLLQIALKCINPSPSERPRISQVAVMINKIKEEEERSISSEI